MKATIASLVSVVILLGTSLAAKGPTTKITFTDTLSGNSIAIAEQSVLGRFNVWTGPGTSVNGAESVQGFLIDWAAGIVQRPDAVRRYEVRFYTRPRSAVDEQLTYVVFYDYDASSGHGFVYLPGRVDEQYRLNTRAIFRGRGLEGHWFRASASWEAVVASVLPLR